SRVAHKRVVVRAVTRWRKVQTLVSEIIFGGGLREGSSRVAFAAILRLCLDARPIEDRDTYSPFIAANTALE
ncbi:MAG: hypothetical protein WBX13_03025, partial [Candidatus Acidiferrales bacterium]